MDRIYPLLEPCIHRRFHDWPFGITRFTSHSRDSGKRGFSASVSANIPGHSRTTVPLSASLDDLGHRRSHTAGGDVRRRHLGSISSRAPLARSGRDIGQPSTNSVRAIPSVEASHLHGYVRNVRRDSDGLWPTIRIAWGGPRSSCILAKD